MANILLIVQATSLDVILVSFLSQRLIYDLCGDPMNSIVSLPYPDSDSFSTAVILGQATCYLSQIIIKVTY